MDLRASRLRDLPESLANLARLEKLDLRWNHLARLPAWVERLEQRGCAVLLEAVVLTGRKGVNWQ